MCLNSDMVRCSLTRGCLRCPLKLRTFRVQRVNDWYMNARKLCKVNMTKGFSSEWETLVTGRVCGYGEILFEVAIDYYSWRFQDWDISRSVWAITWNLASCHWEFFLAIFISLSPTYHSTYTTWVIGLSLFLSRKDQEKPCISLLVVPSLWPLTIS